MHLLRSHLSFKPLKNARSVHTARHAGTQKRVAIVTGAAEGIGRAIATRLATDGFNLGLFDLPRAQGRLEELSQAVGEKHGARTTLVLGDVSKEEDVKGLVTTVVSELGGLYAVSVLWASELN